jgi:hypothetical protein
LSSARVKPLRAFSNINAKVFVVRWEERQYYASNNGWLKIIGWVGLVRGTELHTLALAVRTSLLLTILRLRFFGV